MHSSTLRNKLLKEVPSQGADDVDVAVVLSQGCFLNAFFKLWSPRGISSRSPSTRWKRWVNRGAPIGTPVVAGMTGVVHGRRRWEVRCTKEWEARESQLRDQRKTRVTRKCLLQASLPRTETRHAD